MKHMIKIGLFAMLLALLGMGLTAQSASAAPRTSITIKDGTVSPLGASVTLTNTDTGASARVGANDKTEFACAIALVQAAVKVGLNPVLNGTTVVIDRNHTISVIGFFFTIRNEAPAPSAAPKPAPRSSYEGLRVRNPNSPVIYLVLDGVRRHIPNMDTYSNLFDGHPSKEGVSVGTQYDSIPIGTPLNSGDYLYTATKGDKIYLFTQGRLRLITSPEAFNKYHFSWNKVSTDKAWLGGITEGAPIR